MFHLFNTVDFLREASLNDKQGRLQVEVPGLNWVLYFRGDRIQYAFHPLQRLDHLEQAMQVLNLDIGCRLGECLTAWELGMPLSIGVTELLQQQRLSPTQGEELLAQLTEDALEPLLWINEANADWTADNELETAHINGIGVKVEPYLARMKDRLQQWQNLVPEFRSPYQRPYIEAIDRIAQPVPGGMLPQATLESIVRLMEGRTLQQLALLLKLDPLKLAQLLHPYCRQGIIRLGDIPSPLDGLPQIPVAITESIQTHYPQNEEQNHSNFAHSPKPPNDTPVAL
jgi:hypothetical protein